MCVLLTAFWGLPIANRAESLRPDIGARAIHASGADPDEVLLQKSLCRSGEHSRQKRLYPHPKIRELVQGQA